MKSLNPDFHSHRESGAVAVMVALLLVVLFGFAALAIDVGNAYLVRGQMQNAADAAAHAGANGRARNLSVSDATIEAKLYAEKNGFKDASNSAVVTISIPPGGSGSYTSNDQYVRAVITRPTSLILGQILGANAWQIRAEAVAGVAAASNPSCIVTINGFTANGTDQATLNRCSALIGSQAAGSGLVTTNQSGITIATAPGSITVYNNGINSCGNCSPAPTRSADPLPALPAPLTVPAGLTTRTYTTCPAGGCDPGRYTNPVNLSNNATFNPGFYEFTRGLTTANNRTVTGTDVTFYISSGQPIDLKGTVTLSAPSTCSSGTISRVLYVAGSTSLDWSGNNYNLTLTGVMDLRNVDFTMKGTSANVAYTGSLITKSLNLNGNVTPTVSSNPCYNVYSNSATTVSIFE
ncbi:MAG: hypothetical protein KBD60_08545 [Sterolibacterium sp.]|nr:hypothetical protein [Sterolibacterium sp.]